MGIKTAMRGIAAFAAVAAVTLGMGVMAMAEDDLVIDLGTFSNTYTPDATSADYEVTGLSVTLTGADLKAGDFSFDVNEQMDGSFDEYIHDGFSARVTNAADGSVSFKPGSYSRAGTYYYSVTSITKAPGTGTYSADSHKAKVTVTVEDNDGQLTPTCSVTDGEFSFTYSEAGESWVDDAWEYQKKTVDGTEYVVLKEFTGTGDSVVISGEAEILGGKYPVMVESTLNSSTGHYENAINRMEGVKSISFVQKDGKTVAIGGAGTAKELFRGMESLESVDFGAGITADLSDASGMFEGCSSMKSADFSYIIWPTEMADTSNMFKGCGSLTEIKVNGSFKAGTACTDMFKADGETILKVKGTPSDAFKNAVFPKLKGWNRYLGEVSVTANVELAGRELKKDMLSYRLYNGSETEGNLVAMAKNNADGSISFGRIKVYDTTVPLELKAVQEDKAGVKPSVQRLSASKDIVLEADGSLSVDE